MEERIHQENSVLGLPKTPQLWPLAEIQAESVQLGFRCSQNSLKDNRNTKLAARWGAE